MQLFKPKQKVIPGRDAPPSEIKKHQTYQVGAKVEAKVKGWKKFYAGMVSAYDLSCGTYTVQFEDGDVKSGVKGFNIRHLAQTESFKTPDGQIFSSRTEFRKYMSETFYSFKNRANEKLEKKPGEIAGQTFNINDIEQCEVKVMDHSDQVLVDSIKSCKILIGPSSASVFVRNAVDCELFIACKQFRCRDCKNCTVSLYSKTEPVVETSSMMKFYPYSAFYPFQSEHFAKAELIPEHNHWCNVFDFNKGDGSIPEPHWMVIPQENGWPQWIIENESGDSPENPVPSSAKAEVVPKEASFTFAVSQQEAQDVISEKANAPSAPAPPSPQQRIISEPMLNALKARTSSLPQIFLIANMEKRESAISQLMKEGIEINVFSEAISPNFSKKTSPIIFIVLDSPSAELCNLAWTHIEDITSMVTILVSTKSLNAKFVAILGRNISNNNVLFFNF